ncbi:hypothetical protein MYK68_03940 [Gordonia sp. PP30]|uniref:hypothetical protein n=1 Tax=Gordonia sp. PP30 TaxID=2935861 RepID=UPI001FFFC161|nr:hypothetical protein [Gordonia sp. PP30]UQE77183.1 hypothetical protein MYK68_03940 [Gordonia sp. PP30]
MTQPPHDPNQQPSGEPFQPPQYPGGVPQDNPYQGGQYPGAGIPGTPYPAGQPGPPPPGFGGPAPLTTRPGSVLAAGIILCAIGAVLAVIQVISLIVGSSSGVYSGVSHGLVVVAGLIGLLLSLFAVAAGAWLFTSRSNATRITATVAAALLILTCWGIVATIAVPILLYATETAKRWFATAPEAGAGYPPAPGQY